MNSHSGEIPSRVTVRGEGGVGPLSSASFPGPSPLGETWYTLFVHAQNISVKTLCTFLSEYREIDSSDDLTCRNPARIQMWQYHFSKNTVKQESIYQKGCR